MRIKNTGAAIIIAPGGGHAELWISHEGYTPAQYFREKGINTFVLKYRLAKEKNSTYTVDKDELADIQRAIRLVRSRAAEWHIDTAKIGVMGFSAGGELAALSGMRFTPADKTASDPIDRMDDRPDFQALIYPGNIPRLEVSKSSPPVLLPPDLKTGRIFPKVPPNYTLNIRKRVSLPSCIFMPMWVMVSACVKPIKAIIPNGRDK